MPELVRPDATRHEAWLAAHREWGPGEHEDGFALRADDEVDGPGGFMAYVTRVNAFPAARAWWIAEDEDIVGGIVLRTATEGSVERIGHVGYGVRPSARGRGLATWALGAVLPQAREAGLERVLLVCLEDNVASRRTIERHGGVLEGVVDDEHGRLARYWIDL